MDNRLHNRLSLLQKRKFRLSISCLGLILLLVYLWRSLIYPWLVYPAIQEYALRLVPTYPSEIQDDSLGVDPISGWGTRSHFVSQVPAEAIAQFYHEELSREPWLLYDERSWLEVFRGTTLPHFCFTFQRRLFGGLHLQTYSVEIFPGANLEGQLSGNLIIDIRNYVPSQSTGGLGIPCKDPTRRR